MVKSPYNWVIHTLTQPQVANQQQKKLKIKNYPLYENKQKVRDLIQWRLLLCMKHLARFLLSLNLSWNEFFERSNLIQMKH